jgi:hypothetical protein
MVFAQSAAAASITYNVTLNTAPLIDHPAGPFSIVFVTTDGSGVGDANNAVTVTDVDFHGGSALGSPVLWGGASGSLETSVNLTDTSLVNLFAESFSPGTTLTFSATLTVEDDDGDVPDGLSMYLVDRSGERIPTLAAFADVLIGLDIGGGALLPEVAGTDPSRSLTGGGTLAIRAPTVVLADGLSPTTSALPAPSANSAGWNNSNVNVSLASVDNAGGSGVKQIMFGVSGAQTTASTTVLGANALVPVGSEGLSVVTFSAMDFAGNIEPAQVLTVRIDETPPSIAGSRTASNPSGWNNSPVTVTFQCSDALSGLAAGSPPPRMTISTQGVGQSVKGTCRDVAGNSAPLTVGDINIDLTAPSITVAASASTLWPPNGNVVPDTISGVISDGLSGIDPSTATFRVIDEYGQIQPTGGVAVGAGGVYSFTVNLEASRLGQDLDGRTYQIVVSASDHAGNQASASTVVTVPHDQGK